MTGLNTDPSARLPNVNVRARRDIGFTITFPATLTGVWDIVWSIDEQGLIPKMTNTSTNGFVIAGAVLTFYVPAADNLLNDGEKYYFRVSQTVGSSKILAFISPVTVQP